MKPLNWKNGYFEGKKNITERIFRNETWKSLENHLRGGGIQFSNVGNVKENEKQNSSIYVRKLLSALVLWHMRISREMGHLTVKSTL